MLRFFSPKESAGAKVCIVDIDDPDLQAASPGVLCAEEKHRARRFATQVLSSRYAAAHGALRFLLSDATGEDPSRLRFENGPLGKPYMKGGPAFNLSHGGGLAAMVIGAAEGEEVGIDIEEIRIFPGADDIAGRYFGVDERRCAASGAEGFFSCWVRREAVLKALGTGLSLPLEDVELSAGIRGGWHAKVCGADIPSLCVGRVVLFRGAAVAWASVDACDAASCLRMFS